MRYDIKELCCVIGICFVLLIGISACDRSGSDSISKENYNTEQEPIQQGAYCQEQLENEARETENEKINKNNSNDRFIDTYDKYNIRGSDFSIIYDSKTNNIYLFNNGGIGESSTTSLCILYNSNKEPMKLEEYKNTINEKIQRFEITNDTYNFNGEDYDVVYDKITSIVYLCDTEGLGQSKRIGLSALFGEDGKPITINEYNKTK